MVAQVRVVTAQDAKGKDTYITVPPGTQVVDQGTGEILLDLLTEGEIVKFLDGGKGGLGNTPLQELYQSETYLRSTRATR